MNSFDVVWNVLCYLAAFAVLIFLALWMVTEMRTAKELRQEQEQQAAKEQKEVPHD